MRGNDGARRLDQLGQTVARAQEQFIEQQSLEQVRARLVAADVTPPPSRAGRRAGWLALAAAVVAVVVTAVAVTMSAQTAPERPLSFSVDNDPGRVGRWLAAQGPTPLDVRFSDGTRMRLEPGAGARVRQVNANGAHLLLEHGEADVAVKRRPGARWEVDAGPFRVEVLGTQFQIAWHPDAARFELSLRRGRVRLAGPVLGARTLKPGESVKVWVSAGRLELRDGRRQPKAPSVRSMPTPTTQPVTSVGSPDLRSKKKRRASGGRPYRALVRRGQYRAALDAAGRAGWALVLRREGAASLRALGDAARLAGEPGRASEIFVAVRRRFPGGRAAALAAFALGRIAFDTDRAHRRAARWFETYLKEQPSGSLCREALGRLLEAQRLGGQGVAARQTATRYLKRYPEGPHARLARSVFSQTAGTRP